MEPAYYTPLEVTDRLPLSRSGVYKLLKTGEIPSKRIGKKYVIPRGAFDRWLATCDTPEKRSVWETDPNHAAKLAAV